MSSSHAYKGGSRLHVLFDLYSFNKFAIIVRCKGAHTRVGWCHIEYSVRGGLCKSAQILHEPLMIIIRLLMISSAKHTFQMVIAKTKLV